MTDTKSKKMLSADDVKELKKTLGRNLERIRKERGISRRELAEAIGITENSFGAYSTGLNFPTLDKLYVLSVLLDVSISDLLGDVRPHAKFKEARNFQINRAIEILNRIGFSVIDNGELFVIKNIVSDAESQARLVRTLNIERYLLPTLIDDAISFGIQENIPLRQAFLKFCFGLKPSNTPK